MADVARAALGPVITTVHAGERGLRSGRDLWQRTGITGVRLAGEGGLWPAGAPGGRPRGVRACAGGLVDLRCDSAHVLVGGGLRREARDDGTGEQEAR